MQRVKTDNALEDNGNRSSSLGVKALVLLAGALGTVFILGAVFYVWLYVQQVQNGYRLSSLHDEYEQLVTVQRKLRLEWSRFQDPHHLEELGRREFGLSPPKSDQKISVQ
jgi:cell division protein FtsB